ncbi:formyltransferase [Betaproteobacteria bacterium GR16-43]|nr:formyltransferase [Betaproteobacteria bacterium GR16-43]
MNATAVVFAYHDVGVRCLSVLLDEGVDVKLVVTHEDDPKETVFFGSVRELATRRGVAVETPADANAPEFVERLRALAPDFIFSFYYRKMLSPAVLATAKRGAFNMHGSLLPKYRGRAPVNWAILKGERWTGATLHEMVAKPDAGRIVGWMRVPIGEDDLAIDVFRRVTAAAAGLLWRDLSKLLDGTAILTPQDLSQGSYFGGRKPEDGRIDWTQPARAIHDLVRAVAPPYPGAFTTVRGKVLRILRTRLAPGKASGARSALVVAPDGLYAFGGDGNAVEILELDYDGSAMPPRTFCDNMGPGIHAPDP